MCEIFNRANLGEQVFYRGRKDAMGDFSKVYTLLFKMLLFTLDMYLEQDQSLTLV